MAGNSADYIVPPELIENVRKEGHKVLATGRNPVFTKSKGSGYKICAAIIDEAKKIVAMGYNARFCCSDPQLLKEAEYAQKHRDREKGVDIDE